MSLQQYFHQYISLSSIFACIILTISYVASLYIWKSTHNRDHPSTIKRRFFSVFCMMILAPFFTQYFITEETLNRGDFYVQLGLRSSGILYASILPLILTMILFLGPLTMHFFSGSWKLYSEPVYWISSWQDLVWVRNHFVAPLSEEWVFRACMMPLLLQCLQPLTAVFVGPILFGIASIMPLLLQYLQSLTAVYVGPILFGIAHFHHIFERMKAGCDLKLAIMISVFQFAYTTLFGAYSAYLFVRTGHFAAPLVAHVFCNHMGFPNFSEIGQYPPLQRVLIIASFLIGFCLWCVLLTPMTSPNIYDNRLHIGV